MKIFMIDDEQVSHYITHRMFSLNQLAGDIHPFFTAKEALVSIDKIVPDVILLDLNMPIMDGWEFLDALAPKWASMRDKCKIYVLTSSFDYLDKIRVGEHPMISGLMHKPIKSEDIKLLFHERETL